VDYVLLQEIGSSGRKNGLFILESGPLILETWLYVVSVPRRHAMIPVIRLGLETPEVLCITRGADEMKSLCDGI
jgi:hypothetical protein